MAIRIAQASSAENGGSGWDGKAKPGNQNGKELNIKNWYTSSSKPWHTILRPKDNMVAQSIAYCMEKLVKNKHIGYDQSQRNTAHDEAKRVNYNLDNIITDCETDCSALVTLACIAGGIKELEYTSNAPRTANMVDVFRKTNRFDVITGTGITNSDKYLKRGDILVRDGHTVMVLDDSSPSAIVTPTQPSQKRQTLYEASNGRSASRGADVTYLKQRLTSMGFGNLSLENDIYTKGTADAVQYYQLTHNLVTDRICGDKTWASIG